MNIRLAVLGSVLVAAAWAQPAPFQAPDDVLHERDVEYSRVGERVAMDVLRPRATSTEKHPAIVLVHGGGFRAGRRESYLPVAARLAQRGYVAAAVSYRLAPRHQFPAPVEDVKAAVRFLRANAERYGLDSQRIGAMGGSAGGHLVLFLGLTGEAAELEGTGPNREFSSKVNCVVNYYGPTDFTQSYSKSVDAAQVLPLFLGGHLDQNRRIHQRASPLNWVTPNAAPVLSIHGTEDTYVAYEHSVWLTERLLGAGVPAELETISGAGHGFKGADAERAEARAFAFFDKHLKTATPQRRVWVSDHGPQGEVLALDWPSAKVVWSAPNARGHDVHALPNGNVLFTIGAKKTVVEMNPQHQVVWSYGPEQGLEHPLAAQRLPNGNTLIGDAKLGRVIEVTPDKRLAWQYASDTLANMRMRNAHRTAQGSTLIAVEAEAKVIEVDSSGRVIWSWQANGGPQRRLYQARRLPNGHTLVSLSDPGEIIEVDPSGKIVRTIGGENREVQLGWASGFDVLPDGHLFVADYTGRRLLEVDAKGKIVHEWRTGARAIASVDVVE